MLLHLPYEMDNLSLVEDAGFLKVLPDGTLEPLLESNDRIPLEGGYVSQPYSSITDRFSRSSGGNDHLDLAAG